MSNYEAPSPKTTWRDRLRWKLFPAQYRPYEDLPDGFEDAIYINVTTCFSWVDRIRILFSGRILSNLVVPCEKAPGKTMSSALTHVLPIKALEWRQP